MPFNPKSYYSFSSYSNPFAFTPPPLPRIDITYLRQEYLIEYLYNLMGLFDFVIAGGAARQLYCKHRNIPCEPFGSTNIDTYSKDFYASMALYDYLVNSGAAIKRESSYAETLLLKSGQLLQIIKDSTTDVEQLFNMFDFTCCQFLIKREGRNLILVSTPEAIDAAHDKKLSVQYGPFRGQPKFSRLCKYILQKDYTPDSYLENIFESDLKHILKNYNEDEIRRCVKY